MDRVNTALERNVWICHRWKRILAESRETDELLEAWSGWRSVSPALRDDYQRFVEIANAGAVELGFADMGEMWRSSYDMEPDEFRAELERLWEQVRPLYESLHCLVRAELGDAYGTAVVDPGRADPGTFTGEHVEPNLVECLRASRARRWAVEGTI